MTLEEEKTARKIAEEQKLKKLVVELLDTYGHSQFIRPMERCQPAFIEGLYWHTIWIAKKGGIPENTVLKGKSIEEVVARLCKAFKSSCHLEATKCNCNDKIVIAAGDGTGAVEKFLVECELLGIAGGEEDGKLEEEEKKLAEKILGFFGIELQVRPVSHLVWPTAAEDGDRVVLIHDFSREAGEEKKQLEHGTLLLNSHGILQETSLFVDEVGRGEDEKLLFLESLGMLREVRYGLDIKTLEPKRVVVNPFFGCNSKEEVEMKLDLLG